jgi:signal transduction histidine kinase
VWRGIGLPSSEQLALGSPYAAQATALLEYERSRRELSVLALATEHERIGAELQNTVIHDLFAIGLALNGIGPAVSQPGAHRALDSAVDDLDAVIRLIRTTIFQLRTSTGGG